MRQALHVFRKDVRQLWYLIVLVLGLTAGVAATGVQPWTHVQAFVSSPPEGARPLIAQDPNEMGGLGVVGDSYSESRGVLFAFLLVIAWWFLIARVVHAEAIVGNRQFWLTRPYNRGSLWAAKAVFVLAFVNVPLLLAQAVIIAGDGLPLGSYLSGLLWEEVLVTVIYVLPAMTVAALTRTTTQFVMWLLAAGFVLGPGITLIQYGLVQLGILHQSVEDFMVRGTDGFGWVPHAAGLAAIAVTAAAVLLVQYLRRQTGAARALAAAGCVSGIAMLVLPPWAALFRVESAFRAPAGSLSAEFVPPRPSDKPSLAVTDTLALPVRVSGVPPGTLLACEAASVRLDNGSGAVWNSGSVEYGSRVAMAPNGCLVRIAVDHDFFRENRDRRMLIRGALYVTLFGGERTTSIASDSQPVEVPGVGTCRANVNVSEKKTANVLCRVGFRWPRRLVWARDGSGRGTMLTPALSYSPFPADLAFDPVDNYHTAAPMDPLGGVTVVSQEPTAHVRFDMELRDVRLGDVEWGARTGSKF